MARRPISPSRGRGRTAGINAQQIVAAARALDPSSLTMQAVAAELGVDRSAVNYHVKDREGLLELVARDSFWAHLSTFRLNPEVEWTDASLAFARALRDAYLATGKLVDYVRYDLAGGEELLASSDSFARVLLTAGFSPEQAGRAILLLSNISMSLARDLLLDHSLTRHPQPAYLQQALATADDTAFGSLRTLLSNDLEDVYGEDQLQFAVTLFTRGMAGFLLVD